MGTNTTNIEIVLADNERALLERVARSPSESHRDVVRAQTILLVAEGMPLAAVGRKVGLARRIVRKWAERFSRKRLQGLDDKPRSGRPPRFSPGRDHSLGEARV